VIFLFLPLLLGIAAFAVLALLGQWYARADPAKLARTLRSGGGVALMAVGAFLLARGQIVLGFSLIGAGLSRLGGGLGHAGGPFAGHHGPGRGRSRRRPGQSSTVRTARVEASLDHDSGEMDGQVLAGRFEGAQFSAMKDGELLALWRECADDEESRLLVEAYLDRRRPRWREDVDGDAHGGTGGSGRARGADRAGAMTEQDAYEILGLEPGASEAEIRAAHRRLMKQMHPDQGGSTFFAAKLNEAKDVLLRRRR
jgi:hypothetical protein